MMLATGVAAACLQQQVKVAVGQENVRTQQGGCEAHGTPAMFAVMAIVHATGIVQEGEELDHLRVGSGARGEPESVHAYPGPVADAVNAVPIQLVAFANRGDEGAREDGLVSSVAHGAMVDRCSLMA